MPVDLIIVLLIILVVVLMVRGPKTLPKWGEALGKGVKDAKSEAAKAQAEIQARTGGDSQTPGDTDHPS